jgi:hypothetical protein
MKKRNLYLFIAIAAIVTAIILQRSGKDSRYQLYP